MEITILSIRQPWAELIMQGKKTIELRTWKTNFRGEFYIHVSKTIEKEKAIKYGFKHDDFKTGVIIGKVTLTNVKHYFNDKELFVDKNKHFAPDYKTPCYGFLLENPIKINPIKYKGNLGFRKTNI